jgi:chemotaxis protein CheX
MDVEMANEIKSMTLSVAKNSTYTTMSLLGKAQPDNVSELRAHVEDLTSAGAQDLIINCQNLSDLSISWVQVLLQIHQKLKKLNKQIRLINVNDGIATYLKQEGVTNSLRLADNLQTALSEVGLKTPKILDVNFINPFLSATIKVLQTQTQTTAKPGQIYKKDSKEKFLGDISGVIGMVTDAFSGSVVISFPGETFLKIMSRMLQEECTVINKDIEDGAGELTNIIFGQAKVILNEQGFGIKTALPSVITGSDHSILNMSSGPRVVIPFSTDVGDFFIEICTSA